MNDYDALEIGDVVLHTRRTMHGDFPSYGTIEKIDHYEATGRSCFYVKFARRASPPEAHGWFAGWELVKQAPGKTAQERSDAMLNAPLPRWA